MTDAEQVQRDLYAWAGVRGILTDSALRESGTFRGGNAAEIPFGDKQADYFRTRRITRIRVEPVGGGKIVVSTRLPIAATKIEEMRKAFNSHFTSDDITLDITTAPLYKVDQSLTTMGPTVRRRESRVTCGSSVGIGNQRNAGTLTALARRADSDDLFGLSCNHVIGGCSTTVPGTLIVVPGIQDVTAAEEATLDVVGTFDAAASMRQGLPTVSDITDNADLACFRLNQVGTALLTSMQGVGDQAYDTPTEFVIPEPGDRIAVQKWGRSTAWTTGRLTVPSDPISVEYSVVSYFGPQVSQKFTGTIYFPTVYEVSGEVGRPFSAAGDSGSLVVTAELDGSPPRTLGVLIAGGTSQSLVLPLQPMLAQLQLELVNDYPKTRRRG